VVLILNVSSPARHYIYFITECTDFLQAFKIRCRYIVRKMYDVILTQVFYKQLFLLELGD
jgi:hypothetical protein